MAIGDPTGADLCSGTTDGDTLPIRTTTEDREISLGAGTALISGMKYAIIVTAPLGDGNNYCQWRTSTADPYDGGLFVSSSDAGSTWTQWSDRDFYFITRASGVNKDSNTTVSATYTAQAVFGSVQCAQTFIATSNYTITSVILRLARWGNPNTLTVSIKATVGTPIKATNPSPANAVSTVTLDQTTISWEDGGGAASYDVYYGVDAGHLNLVSANQTGVSFTISGITNGSPFDYTVSRAWRIDSKNDVGTTTGDVWTFTTITFAAPAAGGRGGVSGGSGGTAADKQLNTKTRLVAFARNKVFYEDT